MMPESTSEATHDRQITEPNLNNEMAIEIKKPEIRPPQPKVVARPQGTTRYDPTDF